MLKRNFLLAAVIACNLSSFTSGILLTWTSPVLPKLGLDQNPFGRKVTLLEESWIGSCLALGAIFGPVMAGLLADKIGRKNTMLYCSGFPFLVSFLVLAFAKTPYLYYIARFTGGLGVGNLFTTLPMYFGEIAEPSIRGAVCSSMNVFIVLGELYAFCIGPYTSIMVFSLLCAVLPAAFITIFFFFPKSPYYLVAKNEIGLAEESLMKFRNKDRNEVQDELKTIKDDVEKQQRSKGSLRDIYKSKGLRKGLLTCFGLVAFQQFSGITVVQFYVTNIFEATGSSMPSDICSMIVGFVQVVASFVTPVFVDRAGRKVLILVSAVGMMVSEVSLGAYFYIKDSGEDVTAMAWLPITSLVVYIITYNQGLGPLPWTVMAEVFPSNVKAAASTVTASTCWILGFLVANLFGTVVSYLGMSTVFWIFSGFNLLAALFTCFYVIETKGKTFQEIQTELNK